MSTPSPSEEKLLLERVFRRLLPEGVTLLVNPHKRAIAVFGESNAPQHRIETFALSEWRVLLALAEAYPHYNPYEALMARLMAGPVDYYRERWHQAQQQGALREELRPVRLAITNIRAKLRSFLLTVAFIPETGYLLVALPSNKPDIRSTLC